MSAGLILPPPAEIPAWMERAPSQHEGWRTQIEAAAAKLFPGSTAKVEWSEYESGRWCADVMVRRGYDRLLYVESTRPTLDEALRNIALAVGVAL